MRERQIKGQNTTKAIVARYMKEKKLSSGETTHNVINELIVEGKLNVEEINSQVHFLTINEKFNFDKLQAEVLKSYVQEALKPFGDLIKDTKISIKRSKKPNSDEYDIDIHVETEQKTAEPHEKSS